MHVKKNLKKSSISTLLFPSTFVFDFQFILKSKTPSFYSPIKSHAFHYAPLPSNPPPSLSLSRYLYLKISFLHNFPSLKSPTCIVFILCSKTFKKICHFYLQWRKYINNGGPGMLYYFLLLFIYIYIYIL